jgi:hypothetical protein
LTADSGSTGYINYAGTTKTNGQLYGGTSNPSSSTRLNYDGNFYATKFIGDGSELTGITSETQVDVEDPILAAIVFGGQGSGASDETVYPIGPGSSKLFWENDKTLSSSYTISSDKNTMTIGPITLDDGVEVTIPDGGVWTIV